ncbi:hypothetical protein SHJG_0318 [Streptomyces hygroscopicus subsp. jinggangensis 5008]|nr:hypothetical protein SHJG_0318 [Streptomyces hygroscopicus subsp. jinggangensis 5008]AGF59818.1 hypothetical protein SHJGH_0152 [Streptomyces hygroscopicus subsp. jinggangensis TL01]
MGSSDEFVTRYAAVWNETDSGARRKAVADLWAEDGHYANVGQEYRGHEAVAQAIDEAYEDFVSKGFSFTVHSHLRNHDAIRIVWHMVPTGGGDVAAVGTEFITVDAAGRILTNYQFMDIDPGQ